MVKNIWKAEKIGSNALQRWQNKIRTLRQYLWGWAKHTSGVNKKEKQKLRSMADTLDKKAETMLLSPQEIDLKHYINERLAHMLREEEIKWYQRAKVKDLLQGDSNTQYFHLVANGKTSQKKDI